MNVLIQAAALLEWMNVENFNIEGKQTIESPLPHPSSLNFSQEGTSLCPVPDKFDKQEQNILKFFKDLNSILKDSTFHQQLALCSGTCVEGEMKKEIMKYFRKVFKKLANYLSFEKRNELKSNRHSSLQPQKLSTSPLCYVCPCCGHRFYQKIPHSNCPTIKPSPEYSPLPPPTNEKKRKKEDTDEEEDDTEEEEETITQRKRKGEGMYANPLSSCKKHIGSEHYPIICLACKYPTRLIELSNNRWKSNLAPCQHNGEESLSSSCDSSVDNSLYDEPLFYVGADRGLSKKKDSENCTFSSIQTFVDHLLLIHFRTTVASKGQSSQKKKKI